MFNHIIFKNTNAGLIFLGYEISNNLCIMKNQTMLAILKSPKYYALKITCYNSKINNYGDLNFLQNIQISIY